MKIEPISANEGCTRLWKSEIHFDGVFEGLGVQPQIRAREASFCSLPPGYDKPVPEGYIVFRPKTYHLYVGLRPVAVNGGTLEEAVAYSKQLKAYPLANASNPGAGRYIDAFPKTSDTLPKYDLSYFEDLSTVVNEEPVQQKDLVMMGMVPSLGIRKGQPFKPDAETAKTLEQAVKVGYRMMQDYFTTPGKALVPFWSERQWQTLNLSREQAEEGFPFVTADELLLDPRGGGC